MLPSVTKTIDVSCDAKTAFSIFTNNLSTWWPKDKHSVSAMGGNVALDVQLDPRLGGEIIELDHKGDRLKWGTVTAFDEGEHLSIDWHIGRPADQATKVDVRFENTKSGARVTLTHSGWEVMGDEAAATREGYNNGWVFVFETCFAQACA